MAGDTRSTNSLPARDDFTRELIQRLRNVRQKTERVRIAHETLRIYGPHPSRDAAVIEAATNLEAAEVEFAEYVYDVLELRVATDNLEPAR